MSAQGRKFAIVASRWNDFVTKQLVEGALQAFRMHGAEEPDIAWVPGAWELPAAAAAFAEKDYAGIACLGCILEGATIHAQQLSNLVAAAIVDLSLRTGVPISWGVLTCATQEEAIERAGMKHGNKGAEAARAVMEIAGVMEKIGNE